MELTKETPPFALITLGAHIPLRRRIQSIYREKAMVMSMIDYCMCCIYIQYTMSVWVCGCVCAPHRRALSTRVGEQVWQMIQHGALLGVAYPLSVMKEIIGQCAPPGRPEKKSKWDSLPGVDNIHYTFPFS